MNHGISLYCLSRAVQITSMDAGIIAINDMTFWEESAVPMGGIKGSGWG